MYLCPETEAPCTADCPQKSTCELHREPLFLHGFFFSFPQVSTDGTMLDFTMSNVKEEVYLNGIVD